MGKKIYGKSVDELVRDLVERNNRPLSRQEIIEYFSQNYPKIQSSTVGANIGWLTVNNSKRTSSRFVNPNGTNDILFKTEDGLYRKYNRETDGEAFHSEGTVQSSVPLNTIKKVSRQASSQKLFETASLPLTVENIENQNARVKESFEYGGEYSLINDCLNRFPLNDDVNIIAMKIALIDVTNSTQLSMHKQKISLYTLAKCIKEIENFDTRVSQGDPDLVNIIARNTGSVNLFSFASKYCCYHNVDVYGRDDYSIFDSLVKEALPHYGHGLTENKIDSWRTGFDYKSFNDCIGQILDDAGIHIEFRRRKFDHFLWYQKK